MKRAFLTFIMAVMLTASLTACTASPSGSGNGTGTGGSGGTTTQDSGANSRARSGGSGSTNGSGSTGSGSGAGATQGASGSNGSTMHWAGRYYADENGDVFGGNDGIGNDIRRATDDMMDNMGNAVNDMTH